MKVDLRYPISIRGISIQDDPSYPLNYIEKFKLRYSVDGTNFLYKTNDTDHFPKVCYYSKIKIFSFG